MLREVQEYGAGLEHGEGVARVVDYGGDAAVGVYFQEGRFLLVVGAEVDGGGFVGEGEFFEEDGDFLAIGGRGG